MQTQTNNTPTNSRKGFFAALLLTFVAAVMSVSVVAVTVPALTQADSAKVVVKQTYKTPKPEFSGSLRDYVAPKDKAAFDKYMGDQSNREKFFGAFQNGLDTTTADRAAESSGNVQQVLAYGFDRDHVWATLSYADVARGAIAVAVGYCKRYVPAFVCNAAGSWLGSMAQGYAPLANHGVWGAIYWNRYTGGRW